MHLTYHTRILTNLTKSLMASFSNDPLFDAIKWLWPANPSIFMHETLLNAFGHSGLTLIFFHIWSLNLSDIMQIRTMLFGYIMTCIQANGGRQCDSVFVFKPIFC